MTRDSQIARIALAMCRSQRWCDGTCDPDWRERDPAKDARWLVDALAGATATSDRHAPGESHRYRIECEVCGERGQIVLSVEPQRTPEADR